MYYTINKSALWDLIDEEVSKVANEAYAEDGTSLYDSIVLTEKDKPIIERFIDDAVNLLVRRVFDICKYSPLLHYKQAVNQLGDPLYYTVDGEGQPTSTQTTTETPFPVYTDDIESIELRLEFYIPDFDASMGAAASLEICRYISMYACAALFQQRRPTLVQEYTDRTKTAIDKAVVLLKSRKNPLSQW